MHSTLPYPSRFQPERFTNVTGHHTFGELSGFLRGAVADEDSRLFSDSMGNVAMHAEAIVAALRLDRHRDHVSPLLMDMLTVLREHRNMVVNLGLAWRGLYEYAAYLQALNNFRVLIGQWLLHAPWEHQLDVTAEDFELVAWRTLGDGTLLIGMYEQCLDLEQQEEPVSHLGALQDPQVDRVLHWWHKLRR